MISKNSMWQLCQRLWKALELTRQRQFFGLLVLMIIGSLIEIVSIGAVLPFLGALSNPDRIFNHPSLESIFRLIHIESANEVIVPLTIGFCAASLISGGIRLFVLRLSVGYAFGLGADIGKELYRRSLHQPYSVHIARNSSEVINGIAIKASEVIFFVIVPAMTLISGLFLSVAIIATLIWILPGIALGGLLVIGVLYALMVKKSRVQLKKNSEKIALESTNALRYLQEGLGGIRDILIDGKQEIFISTFARADWTLRKAQRDNQVISQAPRFIMEAVGMVIIAILAMLLSKGSTGVVSVIPMLAALALGLQRLLPALQQLYQSWSTIHGAEGSLRATLELLEQPMPAVSRRQVSRLRFESEIRLDHVSFQYASGSPLILNNLSLVIPKGGRVGFVGETGSGKSTLLDIVMGLLHPTRGRLLIDGIEITAENVDSWRELIAHVPQDIYLSDGSVRENIAFGVPPADIDDEAVRKAADAAQINEVIESWSEGYETKVGERGVQLSGGQRQRIGIARALYKTAEVIIFDEATSALDSSTEMAVMSAIEALDSRITILMIAHRTSTLKNCTEIITLDRVENTAQPEQALSSTVAL